LGGNNSSFIFVREQGFCAEGNHNGLAVLIVGFVIGADNVNQVSGLKVVIDGRLRDLIRIIFLKEIGLRQRRTRRAHAAVKQHQRPDAADDGNPREPRRRRHFETTRRPFRVVTGFFILIFVEHIFPLMAQITWHCRFRNELIQL
jgi:hypothetical protein